MSRTRRIGWTAQNDNQSKQYQYSAHEVNVAGALAARYRMRRVKFVCEEEYLYDE